MSLTFKALAVAAATIAITALSNLASPEARADDMCDDVYSIVVGGAKISAAGTWQSSEDLIGDFPVGYDILYPTQGLANLDAAVQRRKAECPGGHITIMGHSEGAAIVHAWVTRNKYIDGVNAVLLSDPKRAAGPGSAGLSSVPGNQLVGYPLSGVDADFGTVPVLTICQHDDIVCNAEAGWNGYLYGGAHGRYNFDARYYGTDWQGVIFL
ncbi:cutinase family protein [Nocardia sp. NPDC057440]|uniref:cutinase family protein n=1 Tax=Nocardia sp. NPDC057440 TaxID=3346134 RepID=UPI00366FAFB8